MFMLLGLYMYSEFSLFTSKPITLLGHAVVQLVEALRYKPEGRRFDSR